MSAKRKHQCSPEEWSKIIANSSYKRAKKMNQNREAWLSRLVHQLRPMFKAKGYTLPKEIRITFGWTTRPRKAIGECFHQASSKDGHYELFISPSHDDFTPRALAATVVHECIHTLPKCNSHTAKRAHGPAFQKVMRAMNLEGKATATVGGPALWAWLDPLLSELGPFPGSLVRLGEPMKKPQKNRWHKVECGECQAVFRITAKWLPEVKVCPCCTHPIEAESVEVDEEE